MVEHFDEWCENYLPQHINDFLIRHHICWFNTLTRFTCSDLVRKGLSEADVAYINNALPLGMSLRDESFLD